MTKREPSARTRRRGVGSITPYQTAKGTRYRWQVTVPADPTAPGGPYKTIGRAGFESATAADDALQDYRRASREHGAPVRTSGIPTMGQFSEQWLDGLRLAPSTISGYRKIVRNHIVPQLGSVRVDQVTVSRLKAHYSGLLRGGRADAKNPGGALSANTVSKIHVVIGSILDAAVEDSLIPANPARRTKAVGAPSQREAKRARPEMEVWTVDQLRTFLDWDRNVARDDLYPLWVVYAKTGMRRSEALALRWDDIDLARPDGGGRIAVRRAVDPVTARAVKPTKTYRERAVDIDPGTVAVLKSWKAQSGAILLSRIHDSAYVFPGRDGDVRSPNEVSRRWSHRVRAAREMLGDEVLPALTVKGLRHTHATILMEAGEHPRAVQERLGHADINMTLSVYSHVTATMQRGVVDTLARLFG